MLEVDRMVSSHYLYHRFTEHSFLKNASMAEWVSLLVGDIRNNVMRRNKQCFTNRA